jgi:hypothetical protein
VGFAVCSSSRNATLLGNGEVLDGFRLLVRDPASVSFIDIDLLLPRICDVAGPDLAPWAKSLADRYAAI